MIVLLFGVMYFMMIRPQQRRRREAEQLQSSLGPGDEVVTIGGMHGTVTAVDNDVVTLEIAPAVEVRYARPAIAKVISQAPVAEPDDVDLEADDVVEPSASARDAKD
jgi:preprotein translocase subunit YajC